MLELPLLVQLIETGGPVVGLVFIGVWMNENRRRIKRLEDTEELKKVCRYQSSSESH